MDEEERIEQERIEQEELARLETVPEPSNKPNGHKAYY